MVKITNTNLKKTTVIIITSIIIVNRSLLLEGTHTVHTSVKPAKYSLNNACAATLSNNWTIQYKYILLTEWHICYR